MSSIDNPIQILDDEDLMRKVEDQLNRQHLLKAFTVSPFDVIVTVLKLDMPGTNEEKEQRIRKRIEKFFDYGEKKINLQKHEHFCPKKEAEEGAQLVPNELVLFGVDFMNSNRIKSMYAGTEPRVNWLDDSHCKLVFPTAEEAREALMKNLKHPESQVKMEEESECVPCNWFEIHSYCEMGFQRRLFCRYATEGQDQGIIKSRNFQLFLQAKMKFERDMAKEVLPSLERHVRRLGLTQVLSKNRPWTSRPAFWEGHDQRSREKRGRPYHNDRSERGFTREDRRQHGNRTRKLGYEPDASERPRHRSKSPLSVSGSLNDQSLNFSYLLEEEPHSIEKRLNEEFARMGKFGPENAELSFQNNCKQDEASEGDVGDAELSVEMDQSRMSVGMNKSKMSVEMDQSRVSARESHKDPQVSFSYSQYISQQQEEEQNMRKVNVSQINID